MDDRIKSFLEELKLKLAGLPETEAKEALDYYKEYLNDALDEGKSVEEILLNLDPPEKTALMIKAETSIRKAQNSPGLKNYTKAMKYALSNITKPFSVLLFSIFIFVTYSTALLLFLCAIISATAACILLSGSIYESLKIPSGYIAEIVGTIGSGLFLASLCLLLAFGLYKLCRLIITISSGLTRRMLNKSHKPLPEISKIPAYSGKSSKLFLKICVIAATAAFIIALASGLPMKLFMIFNSMEPSSVTTQSWEYDNSAVEKINITTAHSHIRLEKSNTDKIRISYTQPDWMESEVSCIDGQLAFLEKSNGRLPLFSLVSMHENRTKVTISLPENFSPDTIKLESRGGFVHIGTTNFNNRTKTYTGNIYLEPDSAANPASIKASTSTGIIYVRGENIGNNKNSKGQKFEAVAQSGSIIELETSRGSIFIN